jgi:aryl-alcohol dehydrogenase-like predicted oxidoreductase
VCEELGIGFVPWGPLGQGFLPGKLPLDVQAGLDGKTDLRKTFARFSGEVMKANQRILDVLKTFGEKKGATRAQLALAWLAAQKPWIVPIPGTTKLDHSRENLSSINVNLTPEDLREIAATFARITVHGGRMDAKQMDQIGKD